MEETPDTKQNTVDIVKEREAARDMTMGRIRDEYKHQTWWFHVLCAEILAENHHKGGWRGCPSGYLVGKLLEEVAELLALNMAENPDLDTLRKSILDGAMDLMDAEGHGFELSDRHRLHVHKETGDIANMAMMVADNAR